MPNPILTISELSKYLHIHRATITGCSEKEDCRGFALVAIGGLASKPSNSGYAIRSIPKSKADVLIPLAHLRVR